MSKYDMEDKNLTLQNHKETESTDYQIRLAKIDEYKLIPWPSYKPVSSTTNQAKHQYSQSSNEETCYSIAGRLIIIRDHGKTFFANLLDRDGSIQLYIKKDIIGDNSF